MLHHVNMTGNHEGVPDEVHYDEDGMSNREYDPVIVARDDAVRIRAVLESPHVSPEFKAQVRTYAKGRRADLEASGQHEAALEYEIAA